MKSLDREIIKYISEILGLSPNVFGKTGIVKSSFLTSKNIKFEEDNIVKTSQIWYAETDGMDNLVCCSVTFPNLDVGRFEYSLLISFKDLYEKQELFSPFFGLKFDISDSNDYGTFLININKKWVPMTTEYKLRLALGFECMVNEGAIWKAGNLNEESLLYLEEVFSY